MGQRCFRCAVNAPLLKPDAPTAGGSSGSSAVPMRAIADEALPAPHMSLEGLRFGLRAISR
jgi:hypothetical protein